MVIKVKQTAKSATSSLKIPGVYPTLSPLLRAVLSSASVSPVLLGAGVSSYVGGGKTMASDEPAFTSFVDLG